MGVYIMTTQDNKGKVSAIDHGKVIQALQDNKSPFTKHYDSLLDKGIAKAKARAKAGIDVDLVTMQDIDKGKTQDTTQDTKKPFIDNSHLDTRAKYVAPLHSTLKTTQDTTKGKAKARAKAKAINDNNKIDVQKDLYVWFTKALDIDKNDYAYYDFAKNGTSIKAFVVGQNSAKKLIKTPTMELKGGLFCGNILSSYIPDIYKNDLTVCQKPLFIKHSKGNYKMPFTSGALMTKKDLVVIRKALISAIDAKSMPKNFSSDFVNK